MDNKNGVDDGIDKVPKLDNVEWLARMAEMGIQLIDASPCQGEITQSLIHTSKSLEDQVSEVGRLINKSEVFEWKLAGPSIEETFKDPIKADAVAFAAFIVYGKDHMGQEVPESLLDKFKKEYDEWRNRVL